MTAPLVYVDTETTSLDPHLGQIWEVAVVFDEPRAYRKRWFPPSSDKGEPRHRKVTEVVWQLPVDLGRADPMSLAIGRYHERRAPHDEVYPLAQFADEYVELTRGCHMVGAVPSFDERRLYDLLRATNQCAMTHYHIIDVETLVVGYLAGRPRSVPTPPWDSEALSRAVGIDPANNQDRYTALGDAKWAQALYHAVMG